MQSDLPHTIYNRKGKDGGEFRFNEQDPAIKRQEEANRRAAERRAAMEAGRNAPVTLDELFKK